MMPAKPNEPPPDPPILSDAETAFLARHPLARLICEAILGRWNARRMTQNLLVIADYLQTEECPAEITDNPEVTDGIDWAPVSRLGRIIFLLGHPGSSRFRGYWHCPCPGCSAYRAYLKASNQTGPDQTKGEAGPDPNEAARIAELRAAHQRRTEKI